MAGWGRRPAVLEGGKVWSVTPDRLSADAREWIIDRPDRLAELRNEPAGLFDTELTPFANSSQVHVPAATR